MTTSERRGVRTISRVAFLLTVQGGGELLFGLGYTLMLPITLFYSGRAGRVPSDVEAGLLFAWLVGATVAGLVTLSAGRQNRRYKNRRLGQIALMLGPLFCILGLPLLVYGLLSYRRADVVRVFELGESGASEWEVEHE
jgi:hypothetical protein